MPAANPDRVMTKREVVVAKPYYQMVREVIADNVEKGNLPAGTRLLISAVAERLGVSRPPVKRALELLEQDGVVTPLSSQGYVVGPDIEAGRLARPNLHGLELDLPPEMGPNLGQASWERIYEAVERDVLNSIPFGTFQLSEITIGDYFDVSRTVARDVLSRMDARGLIAKDRSSHWIAGPFGARMLDDAHEVRRMIEPGALAAALPLIERDMLIEARSRVGQALGQARAISQAVVEQIEHDLHVVCLKPLRNRRLAQAVRMAQVSLVINRLFGTYIGVHDETELLAEHALVLDHLLLGDGEGAMSALRHHLDADHARVRARLKVLSVFDAAEIAPYLTPVR
jgi:DNA-binding GntR family transcriptional regulator